MAMITIGGVAMPQPTQYQVTLQDLDSENTTRNEAGKLKRDRIRAGVYKIAVTWQVNRAGLKKITDAVAPASFAVVFFDPATGGNKTATMYAGDRTGELLAYTDEARPGDSLWEVTVDLTQY